VQYALSPYIKHIRFVFKGLIQVIDTNKQVNHQQIALVFKYKALLHVSATVHSHLHGVSVLKNIYSVIVQLASNSR
jgi:hypothetical protein